MKRLRVYIDTSVIGGCFDEEFEEDSRALMAMAKAGEITLLVSDLLSVEIEKAPEAVRNLHNDLLKELNVVEEITSNAESDRLKDHYIMSGVLGKASVQDAHHVALATVSRADMIVSWNFKHIVHFEKMRGFNAVNGANGYPPIEVHCPREVI